jgi:hypothetical protein
MSFSYDPTLPTDKDLVRFYIGDTTTPGHVVEDEEIDAMLVLYPNPKLAAAVICRSLAAKFAQDVNYKVGDVSENSSDIAKAYRDLAADLDPGGITKEVPIALPSFGGRSLSEKEALASDTDAVPPSFYRGENDIPGGPGDGVGDG